MTNHNASRLLTVDALRGIAASMVAVYHLAPSAFRDVEGVIPQALLAVAKYGYLGVPIFFTLSGFVIAGAIKPREVSFGYTGRFMLKRSIRLDPPYWLSIIVDCLLIFVAGRILHASNTVLPSISGIVAHLFYAQDVLGYDSIAAIYWTLCLEVQFYLFLCLTLTVSNKLARALGAESSMIAAYIFIAATIISLAIGAKLIDNLHPGLFLSHWYLFAIGALCRWAIHRQNVAVFAGYSLIIASLFWSQAQESIFYALNTFVSLATGVILYAAAVRGKMSVWLVNRPMLFLGSISYSLYLFHAAIGERFISGVRDIVMPMIGVDQLNELLALALFIASLSICLIAAVFVFRVVEKPAMNLSKRIGRIGQPLSEASLPAR